MRGIVSDALSDKMDGDDGDDDDMVLCFLCLCSKVLCEFWINLHRSRSARPWGLLMRLEPPCLDGLWLRVLELGSEDILFLGVSERV